MSLKYSLVPNLLTSNPDDYIAQVKQVEVVNPEGLIKEILKGRPPLSEEGISTALELYQKAIISLLKEGKSVDLGFVKIDPSIVGVFNSQEDKVDGVQRMVKINANVTKTLREIAPLVPTEKITTAEVVPHIINVKDYTTGEINSNITPDRMIRIQGSLLKVEGENADVGVYFIDSANNEHKVTIIGENKPSTLMVMVPTLSAGDYTLEVRTQYTGGKPVKTTRKGTFNKVLTVS